MVMYVRSMWTANFKRSIYYAIRASIELNGVIKQVEINDILEWILFPVTLPAKKFGMACTLFIYAKININ